MQDGVPLLDEAGNKLVFHSFRHTTVTWLVSNGVPLKAVQCITGHRDFKTLSDRYAHLTLAQGLQALEQMPELVELSATGTEGKGDRPSEWQQEWQHGTPADSQTPLKIGSCEPNAIGTRNRRA